MSTGLENSSKPLVLVDSSYFSIKRATALISWWFKAHPTDPKTNLLPWLHNKVYMEKYVTLFKKNIDNIAKNFGVKPQDIVFARDCSIDTIWRRKLYPGYKGSRCTPVDLAQEGIFQTTAIPNKEFVPAFDDDPTIASDSVTNTEIDTVTMDVSNMDPSWSHLKDQPIKITTLGYGPVVKHNNDNFLKSGYVKYLRVEEAEADDVCAIIAMRVRKLQPQRKIVIVANDRDYLQLVDPNLTVVDFPNFNPITHKKGELSSEQALLHKILAGDTSDDISSCGTNDAKKFACNPQLLANKLDTDTVFRDKFEFNRVLIDFNKIPQDIQDKIWSNFLAIAPGFHNLVIPQVPGPTHSVQEPQPSVEEGTETKSRGCPQPLVEGPIPITIVRKQSAPEITAKVEPVKLPRMKLIPIRFNNKQN
jgi:hypothetical protein